MSYLHDEIDDGSAGRAAHHAQARELTLSTGMVLGIFFGLALLCALFFGFGYNMGSRSHKAPIIADTAPPSAPTDFNRFKPSPGTPASQTASTYPSSKPAEVSAPPATATTPAQPAPIIRTAASTPVASAKPAEAPRPTPANETGLTFTVQVAAVSHQEDADSLIAALKRKNYSVNARTETQDHLIHIQIGPFASKKDADAMRLRLLADGYIAIVK
ncbi:MAG: SPOR domain-containing protein [Acidobacteriaceae bacterium]